MPRFYFPIIDGTRLDDPTGIEFPDADAAKEHARRIATFMPTNKRPRCAWNARFNLRTLCARIPCARPVGLSKRRHQGAGGGTCGILAVRLMTRP